MVKTVLSLRFRLLGNQLMRNPWQLVGFIFGALAGGGALLLAAVVAAVLQGTMPIDVLQTVAVLAGAVLILGWGLAPVIVAGMDLSIDASRLAPFPLSTHQIQVALWVTGISGVAGIVTLLAALVGSVLWLAHPLAFAVAVPCALLGVITCITIGRLIGALGSGIGGSRRGRELVGTIVLILAVFVGPILSLGSGLLGSAVREVPEQFVAVARIMAWTPLGATWAVPGEVAAAEWAPALAKLAIALATPVGLWLLWRWVLVASRASPPRAQSSVAEPGAIGWFGRMSPSPIGATWARSLTYWLRDPRYLRQLLMVPLIPLVVGATSRLFDDTGVVTVGSSVLVAMILGLVTYTDISYDGTAFASVLSTGVRGRDDRFGRLLGAASVGIPLTLAVVVITVAITGREDLLPAALGGSFGALLAGYAVCAVSSALLVMPVASPGDSPFASVPGQNFFVSLLFFVVWAAAFVVSLPALLLAVMGLVTADEALGWASLVVGLVLGTGVCVGAAYAGGAILDRTAPTLLARITAFPR